MRTSRAYTGLFLGFASAQHIPRALEVPDSFDLPALESFAASAKSRVSTQASSLASEARSVFSEATSAVASAVPSDVVSKVGEVFATETPSAGSTSPTMAAGLLLLNGAIGMVLG
ncbi:hypothetical protein DM02DRAFT_664238 [Periconia macrospinosa]|uniref:Uncharacterized protein n=1 Tax=Periconia macrospinosa TaxID=97972 RepID=A0A2V1CZR1_9PLEO|nr:hypothetical protein DM02DRAFT_664238 [Periconia macrospinosa]